MPRVTNSRLLLPSTGTAASGGTDTTVDESGSAQGTQYMNPACFETRPTTAIPAAIDFMERVGLDRFREHAHELARVARRRLTELTQLAPPVPDSAEWYVAMASVPLPAGDAGRLQDALWRESQIEVPVVEWQGRRSIRVSCHLYNTIEDIDRLLAALRRLL